MSYYRLYFMDGLSGHVTGFTELEAKTEAAAIDQAERQRGHVAMELWCGRKKVKCWAPNFSSASYEPELPD
jgi:hypothetical protein